MITKTDTEFAIPAEESVDSWIDTLQDLERTRELFQVRDFTPSLDKSITGYRSKIENYLIYKEKMY